MAMEDMEAMEVMAAMVDTDTAKGLLMPTLMPTMAMAAMAVATEDMVGMAAMVDTDTERGQLIPMPTMAMVDMADMAVDMADMADMATESKLSTILYLIKATNQTSDT